VYGNTRTVTRNIESIPGKREKARGEPQLLPVLLQPSIGVSKKLTANQEFPFAVRKTVEFFGYPFAFSTVTFDSAVIHRPFSAIAVGSSVIATNFALKLPAHPSFAVDFLQSLPADLLSGSYFP